MPSTTPQGGRRHPQFRQSRLSPAPTPKAREEKGAGGFSETRPVRVGKAGDVYEGPLKIVAVLDVQRIYVFQNDKLVGFSTISAGKKGKETPTGIFHISCRKMSTISRTSTAMRRCRYMQSD